MGLRVHCGYTNAIGVLNLQAVVDRWYGWSAGGFDFSS